MAVRVVKKIVRACTTSYVEEHNAAKRKYLGSIADELSVRIKDEIIQAWRNHQSPSGAVTQGDADDTVVSDTVPANSIAKEVSISFEIVSSLVFLGE